MARECLVDTMLNQSPVPRIAGRETYLAGFHVAEALLCERTGKIRPTVEG
jgi:hypothetical protein